MFEVETNKIKFQILMKNQLQILYLNITNSIQQSGYFELLFGECMNGHQMKVSAKQSKSIEFFEDLDTKDSYLKILMEKGEKGMQLKK